MIKEPMVKEPMCNYETKKRIMDLFPNEATFRVLVNIAAFPDKDLQYHAKFAGFEEDGVGILDAILHLLDMKLIENHSGTYNLSPELKKRHKEAFEILYASCPSCKYEAHPMVHGKQDSRCTEPSDYRLKYGLNSPEIQLTGCTKFVKNLLTRTIEV